LQVFPPSATPAQVLNEGKIVNEKWSGLREENKFLCFFNLESEKA